MASRDRYTQTGYRRNESGNRDAMNTYDVELTPALFFGDKENGEIQRHEGIV